MIWSAGRLDSSLPVTATVIPRTWACCSAVARSSPTNDGTVTDAPGDAEGDGDPPVRNRNSRNAMSSRTRMATMPAVQAQGPVGGGSSSSAPGIGGGGGVPAVVTVVGPEGGRA